MKSDKEEKARNTTFFPSKENIYSQPELRYRAIDICRGLLFILMINTHALTITNIPRHHWLWSDFWLPNGWATLVFVVLSGYSVGFLYSQRPLIVKVNANLIHRSQQILSVMITSNLVFAVLRDIGKGKFSTIISLDWFLGFITLETDWTISGVLLPTSLVLLCGPSLIQWSKNAPLRTVIALVSARIGISALTIEINNSTLASEWTARFFLLEGLGGFPVLPFVLNGCIGIWLGVQRVKDIALWWRILAVLMVLQLFFYISTFRFLFPEMQLFTMSFEAVGKFSWVFILAQLITIYRFGPLSISIETLGKYALCSFIFHRIFIQATYITLTQFNVVLNYPVIQYTLIFSGAFAGSLLICAIRERSLHIDQIFRRFGL